MANPLSVGQAIDAIWEAQSIHEKRLAIAALISAATAEAQQGQMEQRRKDFAAGWKYRSGLHARAAIPETLGEAFLWRHRACHSVESVSQSMTGAESASIDPSHPAFKRASALNLDEKTVPPSEAETPQDTP